MGRGSGDLLATHHRGKATGGTLLADKGRLTRAQTGKSHRFLRHVPLGKLGFDPLAALQGKAKPSPLLLGDDEDVVEQEEVAEAAGAAAEEPGLLREQQVQLAPLPQPPGHRDQRERLEQSPARLSPCPPHQQQATPRQEVNLQWPWAQQGWTPRVFKRPL